MRAIDYFDKGAEAHPDRVAILDRGTYCSYRSARASSEKISRAMRAAGLRDEDRAAIYSINDGRVLLCMLGLMRGVGAAQLSQRCRRQHRISQLRCRFLALLPQRFSR
jgi:non-ribosomal peptide synthetase component E (peptide arylation enzyme)